MCASALDIAQEPRSVGGRLAFDALLVQRLQQALSRLAERRGLEDEDRHGVGDASLPEQRLAYRRIRGRGELGEALPEICSVIAEGLFGGDAIGSAAATSSERDGSEVGEGVVCLAHPLVGSAEPPAGGPAEVALDAGARGVRGADEILCAGVPARRRRE